MNVEFTTFVDLPDGSEVEATISAYVSPYDPGRLSGPPEDCYPPEGGEIDDFSITLQGTELDWYGFEQTVGKDEVARIEQLIHDRNEELLRGYEP